jgi:hypothetical protein
MGLIPSEVRSYAIGYYPYGAVDALLGFLPFKVFSLFASENAFTFSSSCVLGKNTSRRKRSVLYHRVSKNEEIGWSPKRLPTFGGFHPYQSSQSLGFCLTVAYGFTLKCGVRYRPLTTSLRVKASADRSEP